MQILNVEKTSCVLGSELWQKNNLHVCVHVHVA